MKQARSRDAQRVLGPFGADSDEGSELSTAAPRSVKQPMSCPHRTLVAHRQPPSVAVPTNSP